MPIRRSPEFEEAERERELQERQWDVENRSAKYEHEETLARINGTIEGKHRSFQKLCVALCKAPAMPLAVLVVYLLARKDKAIPEALNNFLSI